MPVIRVDGAAYIWIALGLLILPFSWLMGALVAAVIHELFHFLLARLMKVPISALSVGVGGMVMEMEPMSPGREFVIAAAGPLGSFLLCMMLRIFPEAAVCGMVQGAFNLLPFFPLDGGRMLYCLAGEWGIRIETIFILGFLIMAVVLGIRYGIYPVLFGILVTAKVIQRKIPCKESNLAVQ